MRSPIGPTNGRCHSALADSRRVLVPSSRVKATGTEAHVGATAEPVAIADMEVVDVRSDIRDRVLIDIVLEILEGDRVTDEITPGTPEALAV